jgi:hypothetical protein
VASDDNPATPHKRGRLASFGNHRAAKPKPANAESDRSRNRLHSTADVAARQSLTPTSVGCDQRSAGTPDHSSPRRHTGSPPAKEGVRNNFPNPRFGRLTGWGIRKAGKQEDRIVDSCFPAFLIPEIKFREVISDKYLRNDPDRSPKRHSIFHEEGAQSRKESISFLASLRAPHQTKTQSLLINRLQRRHKTSGRFGRQFRPFIV